MTSSIEKLTIDTIRTLAYCLSQQFLRLLAEGIASRVVSMPCWELFEKESAAYRHSVRPPVVTARVAVARAATFGAATAHGARSFRRPS